MKNIQVIDGGQNCVFDIFAATDDEFSLIFRPREDVAFIDEVYQRGTAQELDAALGRIWKPSARQGRGTRDTWNFVLWPGPKKRSSIPQDEMKKLSIQTAHYCGEESPNKARAGDWAIPSCLQFGCPGHAASDRQR